MRRDAGWRAVLGVATLTLALTCTDGGATERDRPLGAAAQRLVGTWTASFWLEPSTSLPIYAVSAVPVELNHRPRRDAHAIVKENGAVRSLFPERSSRAHSIL